MSQDVIIIDSDLLGVQHVLDKLEYHYNLTLVKDIESFEIVAGDKPDTLYIIDPNSFKGQARAIYKQLIKQGLPTLVTVYPDDNLISEAEALDAGVLEYLKKPLSPSLIVCLIQKCFDIMQKLWKNGHTIKDYYECRKNIQDNRKTEYVIELVEDSQQDAMMMFQLLQPECDIRWHRNNENFKQRDNKSVPDLFILDITINGEAEGYDILRAIKSDPALENVPVIFLTSSWQVKKIEYGLSLGATDYIRKSGRDENAIKARIFTNLCFSDLSRKDYKSYA